MEIFVKLIRFILYALKALLTFIENVIRTIHVILQVIIHGSFRNDLAKRDFIDKTCYLFGNGPSLKRYLQENKYDFTTEFVIVVNDFVKSEYFERVKPQLYIFADPGYWVNDKVTYKEMTQVRNEVFELINVKTKWNIDIFIPFNAFKTRVFQEAFNSNEFIKINTYNNFEFRGFNNMRNFFYKKNLAIPKPQNVLIPSIIIAINSGFNEINILGAEHSWTQNLFVNEKNEVCITDSHFYDKENIKMTPWRNLSGDVYKMGEILIDLARMFDGYYKLRDYANYCNVKVYNCSEYSFIDAFERKTLTNS